jgi:parallel beta-helix repeat protein
VRGPIALALALAVLAGGCDQGKQEHEKHRGAVPPALRAARYVSPSGSDSDAGTHAAPWRTIQKALDSLRSGETAVVRSGVYRESLVMRRAGTPAAPITVRAYPGETVVVRPAGAGEMDYPLRITSGAAYFRFRGFVVEGAPLDSTVNVYVAAQDRPYPHDIEISDCEIRRSTGTGLLAEPNSRRVSVLRNVVHDNGDGSEQHQGIYFQGKDGVIARNVVYGQPNGFGIQVRAGANGVLVANNTAVDNSLSGIVVENTAARVTVVNNIAAFNGGYAIDGYDSGDGPVLPGNVAHHNLGYSNAGGEFMNGDRTVIDFSADRNVVADPRFVDREAHNFRLRPSSPARGKGDPRYQTDIGAY